MAEITLDDETIDRHVGARVRSRRKFLNISQERLASALKITFQQVQKYEKGSNRISASKLFQTAQFLDCDVGYFFEGLQDLQRVENNVTKSERAVHEFIVSSDGLRLANAAMKLSPKIRRRLTDLASTMASQNGDDSEETVTGVENTNGA